MYRNRWTYALGNAVVTLAVNLITGVEIRRPNRKEQ